MQDQERQYLILHEIHNNTVMRYTQESFESVFIVNKGP